jgi:hypothetical protein
MLLDVLSCMDELEPRMLTTSTWRKYLVVNAGYFMYLSVLGIVSYLIDTRTWN